MPEISLDFWWLRDRRGGHLSGYTTKLRPTRKSDSRHTAIVVLRIYNLWDDRKRVASALMYAFVACISSTVMIGFVCELQLKRMTLPLSVFSRLVNVPPPAGFSDVFGICVINVKPKILPVLFGVQVREQ